MRTQRTVVAVLLALCVIAVSTPADAETISGNMNANVKIFTFIPDNFGTVQITVMGFKTRTFIVIAISSSGEIIWCGAVSDEQLARCDFGGIAGELVVIGISTIQGSQKFKMNVTGPVDENVTRLDGALIRRLEEGMEALRRAAGE